MGPDVARVSAAIYSALLTVELWAGFGGIGETYNDASIVETAYDGCAGAGGFGEGDAARVEGGVAVVIGEVKTDHFGRGLRRLRVDLWGWMASPNAMSYTCL